MRKRSAGTKEAGAKARGLNGEVVGVDLGDRTSDLCVLAEDGAIVEEGRVQTTQAGMTRWFEGKKRMRVVMEVGTHSPWVSRLITDLGHEVLVANPRKLRFIYQSRKKGDKVDARSLARVGRLDPELLSPVTHRPEGMAQDLAVLRTRDVMVRTRVQLVNHVRGAVKATGSRLRKCSTRRFVEKTGEQLPASLKETLAPVMAAIEAISEQIRRLDRRIQELGKKKYPETLLLRQVTGVGPKVALGYVLTLQDPNRFAVSRAVGAYLGLVPARRQSGASDPQLRITKEGDGLERRLLVQSAQYILGPFGPDCDLKRYGLELARRGGANAKKRAVVAVARKLAVLLHHLWRSGEVYEPTRARLAARKAA
jgi:transposase